MSNRLSVALGLLTLIYCLNLWVSNGIYRLLEIGRLEEETLTKKLNKTTSLWDLWLYKKYPRSPLELQKLK